MHNVVYMKVMGVVIFERKLLAINKIIYNLVYIEEWYCYHHPEQE